MRIVICVALGACGNPTKPPSTTSDPCDPTALNLPSAKPLPALALAGECAFTGTQLLKSEAEARERFACAVGKVDWSKQSVVVTRRMLSPAMVGFDALDDGAKITFVSRQRSPCPDDPRPMPIEQTHAYVVPAGADRTFAETSCTVPTKCR